MIDEKKKFINPDIIAVYYLEIDTLVQSGDDGGDMGNDGNNDDLGGLD